MGKKKDQNRKTAMQILVEVESSKAYSNIAANALIRKNDPDSPALVREIVYGVLKNKMYIDYILAYLTDKPLKKIKGEALAILRMGIYQMIFMGSVPEYAAVSTSVDLAKAHAYGQAGFVNAILRSWIRLHEKISLPDKELDLAAHYSIRYSYPEWIVKMWIDRYGESFAEELMAAGNETPDLCIRANTLKTDREKLIGALVNSGFKVEKGRNSNSAIYVKGTGLLDGKLFSKGHFSVQDESSMLAVEVLDPQKGEFLIDVCSAPGGKTLYAAERMENEGRIEAFDIHEHKLEMLRAAAEQNGISIVRTMLWNGTETYGEYLEMADRVLVDAPCSGLGVVRRKPEIKYARDEDILDKLSEVQFSILSASSKYVRSGGILVYTTCTLMRQENEDVVNRFLDADPEFEKLSQRTLFPNIDGTDGFFICKMRKKK